MSGGTKDTGKKSAQRSGVSRARRNAELQMEYNEKMHRLAMLRRRIELAQSGVRAFEARKFPEAIKSFHSYLRILEDWKSVPEGGLTPSHFDIKSDVAELLLISGVYWDLSKLYDRTNSPDKQREFKHYLEKYIMFSRGMPFQHVCLETMRKYISNDKPLHKAEFKNAYKMLGGDTTCFVATALADVCEPDTLSRLRRFRDERLRATQGGRAFIRWYYRNGPALAELTERTPGAVRRGMGKGLDILSRALEPRRSKRR